MGNLNDRWSDWTPESAVSKEIPTDPQIPNTSKKRTDNADNAVQTDSIVSAVSAIPKDISLEAPDLTGVIPVRNGTPLQRLAYEVRDERLIAECRSKAVELQVWLASRFDRHMGSEPFGLPGWISNLEQFNVIERGRLRNVLHRVVFTTTDCAHTPRRLAVLRAKGVRRDA